MQGVRLFSVSAELKGFEDATDRVWLTTMNVQGATSSALLLSLLGLAGCQRIEAPPGSPGLEPNGLVGVFLHKVAPEAMEHHKGALFAEALHFGQNGRLCGVEWRLADSGGAYPVEGTWKLENGRLHDERDPQRRRRPARIRRVESLTERRLVLRDDAPAVYERVDGPMRDRLRLVDPWGQRRIPIAELPSWCFSDEAAN